MEITKKIPVTIVVDDYNSMECSELCIRVKNGVFKAANRTIVQQDILEM